MKYLVNFRRKQLRNVESFTLIEMLIVLLVISALVLLFIPNISRYRQSRRQTSSDAIGRCSKRIVLFAK